MVPREKITIKDFERIAKENEHFLWHFVTHEPAPSQVNSVLDYNFADNPLHFILENIDIPYFETYIDESSLDFISYLSNDFVRRVWNGKFFQGVVVGFNRKRMVSHTFPPYCYCGQSIINIISDLDINYLLKLNLN